jgi:hypothetical protein
LRALIIVFFAGFTLILFFASGCRACLEAFSLLLVYVQFRFRGSLLSLPSSLTLFCFISVSGLSTLASFFEFRATAIVLLLVITVIAHFLITVSAHSTNLLLFF